MFNSCWSFWSPVFPDLQDCDRVPCTLYLPTLSDRLYESAFPYQSGSSHGADPPYPDHFHCTCCLSTVPHSPGIIQGPIVGNRSHWVFETKEILSRESVTQMMENLRKPKDKVVRKRDVSTAGGYQHPQLEDRKKRWYYCSPSLGSLLMEAGTTARLVEGAKEKRRCSFY